MKLSQQQWRSVFELLDTALELPEQDLARWLEELGNSQPQLLAPLRDILSRRAAVATRDFIDPPATENTPPAIGVGTMIGPYRLQRLLGTGGMGDVWLGQRADGQLQRDVAIKLPSIVRGRTDIVERFARERNILATLEHPNIARLYDAGATEHGQPYLVLEYVEGQTLLEYCDDKRLSIRDRLSIFKQVLSAVQFAHARLVIHRDLKPANILVGADGTVRLLDFGIATLVDSKTLRGQKSALTQVSGRALTPQYASPEQIMGEALTTACDVYALGVVLNQLLSGQLPYQLARGSAAELEEAILAIEPTALAVGLTDSVAVQRNSTKRALASELSGDLSAIVAMALRKDPGKRYQTADALAQDIESYLCHRPIEARGESQWALTSKLVRRNRLAFSAAAAVFLALSIGLYAALLQARRAEAQAAIARAEAEKAAFVKGFLLDVFRTNTRYQADPQRARNTTAEQLLDRAAEKLTNSSIAAPDVQEDLLKVVGKLYSEMRVVEKTVALRKRRLDVAQEVFATNDPRLIEAQLDYGSALYDSAGWKDAIAFLTQADAALSKRGDETSLLRARLDLLLAEYWRTTDLPKARQLSRRAVSLYRERYASESDYVDALIGLGLIEGESSNIAGSEEMYRLAVAAMERQESPEAARVQPLIMLAEAQRGLFMGAQAEANFIKGLEISRRINGDAHVDTIQSLMRFGQYLRLAGRYGDSLQMLREAEHLAVKSMGENEAFHLPSIRSELAKTLFRRGEVDAALATAQRALEVREATRPNTRAHSAMLMAIAPVLATAGRMREANRAIARSREIGEKVGVPVLTTIWPVASAQVLLAQGNATLALRDLEQGEAALQAAAAASPYGWIDIGLECNLRMHKAMALAALGENDRAEALLLKNLDVAANAESPELFEIVDDESAMALADIYLRTKRPAEAARLLQNVVRWRSTRVDARSAALRDARAALKLALSQAS